MTDPSSSGGRAGDLASEPASDLVGLVPAAGSARRLGPLPLPKELLPVGLRDGEGRRVRVACESLLDALALAGVARAFVVLREGKEDVARFLGDAHVEPTRGVRLPLAYRVLRASPSLPASLDAAYDFVRGRRVAMGFPDVQLAPADAFTPLVARQHETGADLVLGLVEPERPATTDMVALAGGTDRVVAIEVRPAATALRWCWIVAVWGPRFTELLHAQVAAEAARLGGLSAAPAPPGPELQIGTVVAAALAAGLDVRGVPLPGGSYRDVGTPEDLRAVWRDV